MKYLFNSSGDWIAFRINKYVFDTNGNWIGWLPWDEFVVVNTNGEYIGRITNSNRLYYFSNEPYHGYPGYPGYPVHPGYPGYPGFAGYSSLPVFAADIVFE